MTVLAIDPGSEKSAYVVWDGTKICAAHIVPNEELLSSLLFGGTYELVAIEMIQHMGMSAGASLFTTCVWIGRFHERAQVPVRLVYRNLIKFHHCQSARAKDGNIAQALRDKYGEKGTKANPGVTYGLASHTWQAFALATFITETLPERKTHEQGTST